MQGRMSVLCENIFSIILDLMEALNTEIKINTNRIDHKTKKKIKIIAYNTYRYIHADTTISIVPCTSKRQSLLILIRRCQMFLNMNGYIKHLLIFSLNFFLPKIKSKTF